MNKIKKFLSKFKTNKYFRILTIEMLVILILLGVYATHSNKQAQEVKSVIETLQSSQIKSYTEFSKQLEDKQVKEVKINLKEPTFKYTLKKDKELIRYITDNPRTENFKEKLLQSDVKVIEEKDGFVKGFMSSFLSILFIIVILTFMSKMAKKSGLHITNSTSETSIKEKPDMKFKDIAGNNEIKDDVLNIVSFLKDPKKYTDIGAKIPKGILLYGDPGTGKTMLAKAIAGEAEVPFFSASGSDFMEMYVGVGARRVRNLFENARKESPCIIFIDEIDSIGMKRDSQHSSEHSQTINALLKEMDGFEDSEGIIVIGATNRLDTLDNALIRAGRFDRHISVPLPNEKERLAILKVHTINKPLSDSVNLSSISKKTMGFSGAMLATLLNESAIKAITNNREIITNSDIDSAFTELIMKGKQVKDSNKIRTSEEINIISYHEAGHTLATRLLTNDTIVEVNIIENTSGAGGVSFSTPKKEMLFSKKDIINQVKVLYAGRVAEQLYFGNEDDITTGASSDIKETTKQLYNLITHYGMDDSVGMVNLNILNPNSQQQPETIKRIQELSQKIYNETLTLLSNNKHHLQVLAENLKEKEVLKEKDLEQIFKNMGI